MNTTARTSGRQPQPKAAETYAARRNDIARLLDVLQMELDKHAENANAKPNDWGFAGDLSMVRSNLIEMVGGMSKMTPAEIEAFLNDAN